MFRRSIHRVPLPFVINSSRQVSEYNFGQSHLSKPWGVNPSNAAPSATSSVGEVRVTRLHNGARVVSQQLGGPTVSVGAYILAGPVFDPLNCPGVGSMMHLALTTSNYNNSLFQLDRNIRSAGVALSHFEKYKTYIGIRIDSRVDKWKNSDTNRLGRNTNAHQQVANSGTHNQSTSLNINIVQDNIFTCIAAPRFHESDIERFRDTIDNNLKEMKWQDPAEYAIQQLETVAFYLEPLGSPRFVPEVNNNNITSKVLLDQYSRYVIPSRVVIAGVNVDHNELIAEYENTPYPHSSSAPHHAKTLSSAPDRAVDINNEMKQFTGGERHEHENRAKEMGTMPDMDQETIIAVGWLANGRDKRYLKPHAATLVMREILSMEFGKNFSFTENPAHVSEGIQSFYNAYNTAGLIGFAAKTKPENAISLVTKTAQLIKDKKNISPEELEAAKSSAAARFYSENVDSVRGYCDFLGTCMTTSEIESSATQYMSIEDVFAAIESVTASEVGQVRDMMFSNPTALFGHGEMLGFPSLRQMGL